MRQRERVPLYFALTLAVVASAVLFWRIRRGIDFTDEAFYVGLPVRFVLGDTPFVDELNIAQTSGLFLYPFFKVYMAVRGTTGIFYFVRVLYMFFFGGVGLAVAALARTKLSPHAALLCGLPCLAFYPYAIPGLGYNSLGAGLLTLGLFLLGRALIMAPSLPGTKVHRDPFLWAGFTLGAAAFAYPTLVVGAASATVAAFLVARGQRSAAALRVALGGGMFGVVVLPVFLRAGAHGVRETMVYSGLGGMQAAAGDKGTVLWDAFLRQHQELPMLAVAAAMAVATARRAPRLVALFVPFLPLLARGSAVHDSGTTLAYMSSLALIAPLIAAALRDRRVAFVLLVAVWLPSVISGVAMAYTSGNGAVASGAGAMAGAMTTVVLLAVWISELVRTVPSETVRTAFGFAPLVPLVALTKLTLANNHTYRDGPISQLTALVTQGPYKGLYTTPERHNNLEVMTRDILEVTKESSRTLFYYDFPAGYIIVQKRPLVPSAWIFAMEPRLTMDTARFEKLAAPGDVIVRIEAMRPALNPLDRAVTTRAKPIDGKRVGYTAWRVY